LVFRVELLADRSCCVVVQYDSMDRSVAVVPGLPGAFKATAPVPVMPGGGWEMCAFQIPDPRFCRSVNGADLRIVSDRPAGDVLRLRSARVEALSTGSDETATAPVEAIAFPEVKTPEVTVVIPVFNRLELTLQCLASLRANTSGEFEIIVVSDGSTDATAAVLSGLAGIRLIENDVNRGFAYTCNRGAAAARAPLVVFLNNDTLPQPGWLTSMVRAIERDPEIGIVGSRLLFPETGEVQHAGMVFSSEGYPSHRFELAAADAPGVESDAIVPAVTGACLLIRKDLFDRCRGFDERYRNGFEDLDLCFRVRDSGKQVLYCASSVLYHHALATQGRGTHDVHNLALFLERWRSRMKDFAT
jgi:GT2 family glycosyltransferase